MQQQPSGSPGTTPSGELDHPGTITPTVSVPAMLSRRELLARAGGAVAVMSGAGAFFAACASGKPVPQFFISAIMAVQVQQTLAMDEPLIQHMPTVIRVFVATSKSGPDIPHITGLLRIKSATYDSGAWPLLNPGITSYQPMPFYPKPNPDLASPSTGFGEQSLDFLLDGVDCEGTISVTATALSTDHPSDPAYQVTTDAEFTFTDTAIQRAGGVTVTPVLINNLYDSLPAPSAADFGDSLNGLYQRWPIGYDGFHVAAPFTIDYNPIDIWGLGPSAWSLTGKAGWSNLLAQVESLFLNNFGLLGGVHHVMMGVVTQPAGGDGTDGISHVSGNTLVSGAPGKNHTKQQAGIAMAHEFGHLSGLHHANCGGPTDVDPAIPAKSDMTGYDTLNPKIIPTGTPELMSYCADPSGNRWQSSYTFNLVKDQSPLYGI